MCEFKRRWEDLLNEVNKLVLIEGGREWILHVTGLGYCTYRQRGWCSVGLFCHQSDCGREEAVGKPCCECENAVGSAVPQIVSALFVSEHRVIWVEWVSNDSLCSFRAALVVHVVHGRKCCPYDPLRSPYDSLQSLPLCLCGVAIPDSDACGEDALYQSSVGLGERATAQTGFPEQPDEMEPLLGFLHRGCGVTSPAQVRCNVHSQESAAIGPLHLRPFDDQRLERGRILPEVQDQFFGFVCVEDEVVLLSVDKNIVNQGPVP